VCGGRGRGEGPSSSFVTFPLVATGIDNPEVRCALEKTEVVIKEQAWFGCWRIGFVGLPTTPMSGRSQIPDDKEYVVYIAKVVNGE